MGKVLVVEDDTLSRDALVEALQFAGFDTIQAGGGTAAIRLARTSRPSAMITDIVMEDGEGMELIVNTKRQLPGLPVIAMSGNKDYLRYAEKLGVNETLHKPFRTRALIKALADLNVLPTAR